MSKIPHPHQMLTNRIGNIHFHGMFSTASPWPCASQGLPAPTIQMNRPNPFDVSDGLGNGSAFVHPDGLVDHLYSLWTRNPISITASIDARSRLITKKGLKSRLGLAVLECSSSIKTRCLPPE
jgi:hypothetical protein